MYNRDKMLKLLNQAPMCAMLAAALLSAMKVCLAQAHIVLPLQVYQCLYLLAF